MDADDASGTDSSRTDEASGVDDAADPPEPDPRRERSDPPAAEVRSGDATGADHRREVVVPFRLYKAVTVFSTLFAVVLVVGGMIALDSATGRATLEPAEISLPVAAAGVVAIVLGAAVYAFSTRFRAEGMGNPKEDADEPSDDG